MKLNVKMKKVKRAIPNRCIENVLSYVKQYGGEPYYCWLERNKFYAFHSIWKDKNGKLFDITPPPVSPMTPCTYHTLNEQEIFKMTELESGYEVTRPNDKFNGEYWRLDTEKYQYVEDDITYTQVWTDEEYERATSLHTLDFEKFMSAKCRAHQELELFTMKDETMTRAQYKNMIERVRTEGFAGPDDEWELFKAYMKYTGKRFGLSINIE